MTMKKKHLVLLAIFLIVLSVRLYFAFSTPFFSSGESYFHIRQIESIRVDGSLIIDDPLSYSGRTQLFLPVFDYLISIFGFSDIALKIFLNIFAASLVLFVYLLSARLTKSPKYALYGAAVSGFIPIYFARTINEISSLSIFLPLLFLLIHAFLSVENKRWTSAYLVLLVLLTFLDPLMIVFAFGLALYFVILYIERVKQSKIELELSFFTVFFIVWVLFLVYRDAFILHESAIIWKNIPSEILARYFQDITIGKLVYSVGFIPFVFSLGVIYKYLFEEKNRIIHLFSGLTIAVIILLWFRLLDITDGLIILGCIFSVLFAKGYQVVHEYLDTTKIRDKAWVVSALILTFILITSVFSSFASAAVHISDTISEEEYEALLFLKDRSDREAVVLAHFDEGHYINAIAQRKNIIDDHFLLIPDITEVYLDHNRMFTTSLEIDAVELMVKYNITHIYFSNRTKTLLDKNELRYISNKACFTEVFDNGVVQIIEKNPECRVRIIET